LNFASTQLKFSIIVQLNWKLIH